MSSNFSHKSLKQSTAIMKQSSSYLTKASLIKIWYTRILHLSIQAKHIYFDKQFFYQALSKHSVFNNVKQGEKMGISASTTKITDRIPPTVLPKHLSATFNRIKPQQGQPKIGISVSTTKIT
jgi:hypothetical protein